MSGAIQNLSLVFVALVVAYYFAAPVQDFYCANIGTCTGGFFGFDLGVLIWMMLIYAFGAGLLLTAFGGKRKYWWIGAALAPVFLFQVTIDLDHVYLLIIWSLIAWLLGTITNKTLTKLAPALMGKISG